jgi:hypothetical protein
MCDSLANEDHFDDFTPISNGSDRTGLRQTHPGARRVKNQTRPVAFVLGQILGPFGHVAPDQSAAI